MRIDINSFTGYIDFVINVNGNDDTVIKKKILKCENIASLLQIIICNAGHAKEDYDFNAIAETLRVLGIIFNIEELRRVLSLRNKLAHVDDYKIHIDKLNEISLSELIDMERYVYATFKYCLDNNKFGDFIETDIDKIKGKKSKLDVIIEKLLPERIREKKMKSEALISLFLSKMTIKEREEIVDRMFGVSNNTLDEIVLESSDIPDIL